MPHEPPVETAVSAPGKVLLTGGYLVLDRKYTGTVLALDARIHVIVQQLPMGKSAKMAVRPEEPEAAELDRGSATGIDSPMVDMDADADKAKADEEDSDEFIIVRSPQFLDAVWEYRIQRIGDGGGVKVEQTNDG